MSYFNKGSNHPLWGKTHTEETNLAKGINNPMYGKIHKLETREKM